MSEGPSTRNEVRLEPVAEGDVDPAEVLGPGPGGGPTLDGGWDTDYLCQGCGAAVCRGLRPGMMAGAVLRCGACGALSRVPVPMRAGLLDADAEWLRSFAALHECAKHGELQGHDLAGYRAERDALARTLLAMQQIALEGGQRPRRYIRVARLLQLELARPDGEPLRGSMTLNVSVAGFAAMLERAPAVGDLVNVALSLPDDGPLHAVARVASVTAREGGVRVGFAFTSMSEADADRLENVIFDTILGQMTR